MKYSIKGFPESGKQLELPNIAEFLVRPTYGRVSADDLYKYGGECYRYLLDNAPIVNDKKYVIVMTFVQLLYPEVRSIISATPVGGDDFHRDSCPTVYECLARNHLLVSDSSARTEFNINPIEIELEKDMNGDEFNEYVSRNWQEIGIEPRKIDANRFYTFTDHVHRRSQPQGHEFRLIFRISETDIIEPRSYETAAEPHMYVCNETGGWETRYKNIERLEDKIILYPSRSHLVE